MEGGQADRAVGDWDIRRQSELEVAPNVEADGSCRRTQLRELRWVQWFGGLQPVVSP